ncbi:GNAT family N-acetyltransferase [Streptomyces sp. P9(2023)]|uniref:GNAT family N-acetyltransferase n=1 Tax=Streptomyces sp. P9(2023) TaxID=3064394 RepID=UPI0028F42E46|nr:GNAT family N-acetyltransferase [Streptomyces sp. P9(2023)]MDT9692768.1 GNAT family N-acetyltransferase [Streptomyces sp. P9(2023)]
MTTDRLVLRPWPADEVTAVLDAVRLPHWAEDFPADEGRVIAGFIADRPDALGPYGQRQIIERASGLVIGAIGLFWPPSEGTLEIGYGIVASRRRRGYAPEATRALVEFALSSPDVHTVYADVELSNPASVRVLEKAGLHRWSEDATTARFRTTTPDLSQR